MDKSENFAEDLRNAINHIKQESGGNITIYFDTTIDNQVIQIKAKHIIEVLDDAIIYMTTPSGTTIRNTLPFRSITQFSHRVEPLMKATDDTASAAGSKMK